MQKVKVEKNFKLKLLDEKGWNKVVRRANSSLAFSFTAVGPSFRNKELEFNSEVNSYLRLGADVYGCAEDIEQLKNRMLKLQKKDDFFLRDYFIKLKRDCKEYLLFVNKVCRESSKNLDASELRKLFQEYIGQSVKVMSHIWPVISIQEWLIDEIKKELLQYINPDKQPALFNNVLQTIIAPERLSNTQKRRNVLLEAAILLKKNDGLLDGDIRKEIERIYDKFAWVDDHQLKLKYPSLAGFQKEVEKESKGDPEKKLKREQELIRQARKDKLEMVKKYRFNKRLILFSYVAADLPYMRFLRLEVLFEGGYRLKGFFGKISEAIGINNISDLFFWEIDSALAGEKINLAEASKGRDSSGLLVLNKKVWVFGPHQVTKAKEKVGVVADFKGKLKGAVACLGRAKGRVRVLFSAKDIYKLQNGDILVTSMTIPEFVPAMEKASAFVTDEGGISCHAAIVSREMNKPCIIGTKIATKVLKDGDMVEVDADKGVVKMIKKAK